MLFSAPRNSVRHLLPAFAILALLMTSAFAQKSVSRKALPEVASATVTPIIFPGSAIDCAHLNGLTNDQFGGAFTRITGDEQLLLDFGTPNGNFQYRTYLSGQGPVTQSGSQPSPIRTVDVASSGSTVTSFSSQVQVLAVLVSAGGNSFVYSYAFPNSPIVYSDTNLTAGNGHGIEHVTFCYGLSLAPSAAPAAISGRVVDAAGFGISGASLTITDASTGSSMTVRSNGFGYYAFDGLPAGEFYVVSISDKRYTFAESSRSITLNEDQTGFDFTAAQ